MSAPRTVCLVCRHRLATKAALQTSQWRSQRSYLPGAAASTFAGDRQAEDPVPTQSAQGTDMQSGGHSSRPSIRRVIQEDRRPRSRQPLKSLRRDGNATADADMAVLFRQIVDRPADALAADATHTNSLGIKLVQDIGKLQDMLDAKAPTAESFKFLRTVLYPTITQKGVNIPKVFHTVVSSLMHEVFNDKKRDVLNPDLPSAAEIFRVYVDIGDLNPKKWLSLTGELVRYLCEMNTSADDYTSIEAFEDHLATKNRVILDLVESWKVLSLPRSQVALSTQDENKILDGFWFPRLDKFAISKYERSNNFSLALSSLFPQYAPNQLGDKLAVLAVATLALLIDGTRSNSSSRRGASRFITKVANLMSFTGVSEAALRKAIKATYPSAESYIMGQWPTIEEHLQDSTPAKETPSESPRSSHLRTARGSHGTAYFEKKLSQAYGTRNAREVDRLWHEFVGPSESKTAKPGLQQNPHLFDSFINTYMALNKPDKAIEVWNTLSKVGLKPTLKTWNVMLDGCKKAQNVNGLKTVWDRLVNSGAKLDVPIWTTRIAGLMECNDPAASITALEEMAVLWNRFEQTKQGHAVKPTIEPVNAAMSGLIRLNNHGAVQTLLAWAKRQNITPNIFTFNLLLRPLILDGREKEVQAIFKSMEASGVSADAATFTVILEGTLTRLDAWDPQRQVEIVAAVFENMKQAGLDANHQTYGKMIHLLLRSGDRAQESVKAVLDHLYEQGLELSPHIYTTLVEHFFSRSPPDIAAVNKLIERRRLLDFDDMDRIFYDRVIKGYASAGDPETAFNIYRKLSSTGFLVNLDAQYELLRALLVVERTDDARVLVEDTVKRYAEQHGEGSWLGHRFWHTAERAGIIDWVPDARGGKAVICSRE
ncbi:hypothetical protein BKA67DRAFT_566198 [Truncatella angustata]|uniref:Pentatricopeptide repeat-containing protein n=1 Tax=Truncatella angustata TaxID=152316 RepID=A0A9P8UM51_9PEZI|nr:uncharacterized protein BKA67DRAFT_566198 [Truncatella angustata]KAH6654777.1 hypothetical protein BKA67DRAFT_566198 [Truncatella angustata]